MEDLIPEDAETGVLIVAHPDDEALWCGGLLAKRDILWTVICCSIPHRDPERAYHFFQSCELLGVGARLLPFSERAGWRLDLIDVAEFDVIVTHGPSGEYGHPHHRAVHDAVQQKLPRRVRRFIGYKRGGRGRFELPLDETLKAQKLAALKCYTSPVNGGETWTDLLDKFGKQFDLWCETYD